MSSAVLHDVLQHVARSLDELGTILRASPGALVAFDTHNVVLFANESAERYFGYAPGELGGKPLDILLPARFRREASPPLAVTEDQTVLELPARRRDDSEVMTVWCFAAAARPGGPVFVLSVRERDQVVADLETSTYAAVFEASPVPIALSRASDNTLVLMNQAFSDLFEVDRKDFIGRPSNELEIASFEQRSEIARIMAEQGSVRDFECERRTSRGKRLAISLGVTPVRIGGVDHLLSTVQDLSPRKAQEAALARASAALVESQARADYAVRLSGIGFWYCDLPFDELRWDDRVKGHFFLAPDARVTIDTFYERIVPEDREPTRAAIDASIAQKGLYDVTYRTHEPGGAGLKWIRAMGGASYAADGTPVRFDGVTVDVTRQKRDEERYASTAAQLEEANRVKDDFLALLGHELRNPLAPITMAVQLLRMRHVEGRELDVIERQAKHLTRLVDDLLDVSRVTRGKVELDREITEASELVRAALETVGPLFHSARHNLQVEVPAQGLAVHVDRIRMVQVLSNLLANAAKYTPAGGRIDVSAFRDGTDVVFRVADSGEGMSAELLAHVFDMFVQSRQTIARSQGGLGLGLAIVRSLVELHGGQVAAESPGPGGGSTFTVRIAAAEPITAVAAGDRDARALVAPTAAKRILIVDDNVDGAEMVSEALGALGYETVVAHDGGSALEVAAKLDPDIALLDIGLPVLDGYEVAQRLRATHPHLVMIAITGYGQPEDTKRSRDAGFQAHLTKPVDLAELGGLIAELGSRAGGETAPGDEPDNGPTMWRRG